MNTIFVLIPVDARPADNLANSFNETTKCLRSIANFKEMVVVVITKFDICDDEDKEEAKKDYQEELKKVDVTRFMFSSK